jgi:hypothetical protein
MDAAKLRQRKGISKIDAKLDQTWHHLHVMQLRFRNTPYYHGSSIKLNELLHLYELSLGL